MLVLLDLVEHDVGIATKAFVGLCEDTVLVVVAEGVHEDVGLGAGNVHSALALLDFATLDLGVVTLGHFEARSKHLLDLDTLHNLLGTLALQVDAHDLAAADGGVLDLNGVVGVCQAVDSPSIEIFELAVGDEHVRVHEDAGGVMVFFIAKDRATGQVYECFGEGDDDGNPALSFFLWDLSVRVQ